MTLGLNFGHKTSENSVEKVTILQYTLSHLPLIVDGLGPAEEGVDVDFMYTHVDNDRDVEGPNPTRAVSWRLRYNIEDDFSQNFTFCSPCCEKAKSGRKENAAGDICAF